MAEDFPEDKYDFKPNPAERSFAEQLLHAANASSAQFPTVFRGKGGQRGSSPQAVGSSRGIVPSL
jgi:hypothetical protein